LATLYRSHLAAMSVMYADIESQVSAHAEVFIGSPGTVLRRENASGFRFYAHQFYDAAGRKRERYVAGPIGDADVEAAASALRQRIDASRQAIASIRLLGRQGFAVVDAKTFGSLASLYNHGVFDAGGVLVGPHAYGIMLNQLGVACAPIATAAFEAATGEALAFDRIPDSNFLQMLQADGIPVTELLAPATGLPYLDYLLGETRSGPLLAREGCFLVRVPLPARFAIHKLLVSQHRIGPSSRADDDVLQAAVLIAALSDRQPGAIEDAVRAVPPSARRRLGRAVARARPLLEADYPLGWRALGGD
jgi:hypothetical protein